MYGGLPRKEAKLFALRGSARFFTDTIPEFFTAKLFALRGSAPLEHESLRTVVRE